MRNYIKLGPVSLRVSRKYLAPWGFALVQIGGLDVWSWHNDGSLGLASYHPRGSLCWHWSASIRKGALKQWAQRAKAPFRKCQWHDYYWLPFGVHLGISRQDYHKQAMFLANLKAQQERAA